MRAAHSVPSAPSAMVFNYRSMMSFYLLFLLSCLLVHLKAAPLSSRPSSNSRSSSPMSSSASTLKKGLQVTAGAGSVKDPDILELATVQELAGMDPELSSINKLLVDLGATFYLEQTRDLTMFMPTNSAFKKADIDLDSLPWSAKWQLFQYHVVPQAVIKLDDMSEGGQEDYLTWEGSPLTVSSAGQLRRGKYQVNGKVNVVGNPPGIETFNGISYKVDELLIPPGLDMASMVIEDHQSRGITRGATTAAEAVDGRPSQPSGSAAPVEASVKEEDVRGQFVGRLESRTNVVTGRHAPQFVQDINSAHSQWNDTPDERRERTTHGRGPQTGRIEKDGTTEAVGLIGGYQIRENNNSEQEVNVPEAAAALDNNNYTTVESDGLEFVPIKEQEEYIDSAEYIIPDIVSSYVDPSSSVIKALGVGETVEVFSSPSVGSVELVGSDVPDGFGWAGTQPGWTDSSPGQVSPGSTTNHASTEDGVGITAYLSSEGSSVSPSNDNSEEDDGLLFSSRRRERNRDRRQRARLARLGIEVAEDNSRSGNSGGSNNSGRVRFVPASPGAPHPTESFVSPFPSHPLSSNPSMPLLLPMAPLSQVSVPSSHHVGANRSSSTSFEVPAVLGLPDSVDNVATHNDVLASREIQYQQPPPSSANVGGIEAFDQHVLPSEDHGQAPGLLPSNDGSSYSIQALGLERPNRADGEFVEQGDGFVKALQLDERFVMDPPAYSGLITSDSFVPHDFPTSYQPDNHDQHQGGVIPFASSFTPSGGAYYENLPYVSSDDYYVTAGPQASIVEGGAEWVVDGGGGGMEWTEHAELMGNVVDGAPEVIHFKDTDVMSILTEQPELSRLSELMGRFSSPVGSARMARKIKMTVFAPVNEAIQVPLGGSGLEQIVDDMKLQGMSQQVANNHISIGRQLNPDNLVVDEAVELPSKGYRTKIHIRKDRHGRIFVNESARVLRVFRGSNGLVYEIDQVLTPKYNEGPKLIELLASEPHLSITNRLLGQSDGGLTAFAGVGPLTIFLVDDSGFVGDDGKPLPQCVMDSFSRPENKEQMHKLTAHMVLEDLVRLEDMPTGGLLHPIHGAPVSVSRDDDQSWGGYDQDAAVYIEGKKVLRANIPIHNGLAHIIEGQLPLAEVDLQRLAYWSCLDEHLRSTNRQVRMVLERVDEFKSLPVLGTPPGPRPAWVGLGLQRYFPPHTSYREHQQSNRSRRSPWFNRGGGVGGWGYIATH
eukprot:GHVS01088258.1.p1 GENE.GHVS01088258.1~~GHVS01088258.1.p1  ORF type:complete len:1222 (+),score=226.72 GHVS01088258.1:344-4009(+)